MQTLLEIGLANAVMATALAVVAALVGWCCRKPGLSHVLWLLVLVKLVTPPFVRVPLPVLEPAAVAPEIALADSAETAFDAGNLVPVLYRPTDGLSDGLPAEGPLLPAPTPKVMPNEPAGAARWAEYIPALGIVWLAGSVVWLVTALTRVVAFQRLLRFGRPASAELRHETEQLASRLGLRVCPEVWLVPGRVSPLLWAFGSRPRLILPTQLVAHLGRDQLSTLLAHELAHARRRDHWVRWLELLVTCLYWWHPIAWLARRQLQHAEEQCCDAWVVWTLPLAAKEYARALLQTVDFLDSRPVLPPVASGVGHLYLLKRRLMMIVRQPRSPRLAWPVKLGVLLTGLLVLPLGPGLFAANKVTDDDAPKKKATKSADVKDQDVERRLELLEQKLDKALRALQDTRSADRPPSRNTPRDTEKAPKKEPRAKDEAKHRMEFNFDFDGKGFDKEQMKELHRHIQEMVHQQFDPEKMKELHKQIEEQVHKNFDPEKMKALHKQIEEQVQRSFNPEKMKELHKQIEEQVQKSLSPERMEEIHKQIERAQKLHGERMDTMKKSLNRAETRRDQPSAGNRDLERRLEKLEQKLDRVMESLDAVKKSGR